MCINADCTAFFVLVFIVLSVHGNSQWEGRCMKKELYIVGFRTVRLGALVRWDQQSFHVRFALKQTEKERVARLCAVDGPHACTIAAKV